jgi:competence protein ComEA
MHFNLKERIATLILLLCIGMLTIYYNYNFGKKANFVVFNSDTALTNSWLAMQSNNANTNSKTYKPFNNFYDDAEQEPHWAPKSIDKIYNKAPEYFDFDPNTISTAQWQQLGVKPYVANSIAKYLASGGKFYKAEDLYKIFLLNKTEVDKLIPYIKIEGTQNNYAKTNFEKKDYTSNTNKVPLLVDINYADTASFKALPGIGSYFALNIIKYRMQLGGFNNINQIAEVYGISQSTFETIQPFLRISDVPIQKIDINHADLATLTKHPYMKNKNLAKVIIEYRKQHGNKFNSVEELKNIMILDQATYDKIAPYIAIL